MKKGFANTLNYGKKSVCAFTLLEILLVVGIIAILAGIVIVALNPTKQFAQVRNTQRKANLSELNKALYQYYIDNSRYPTSVPSTNLGEICNTGASSTPTGINCTGLVDLSPLVPTYLVAIPTDPQASGTSTGYLVAKNTANKIYVKASNAELSQTVALGPSDGILPDHLVSYWSFDGNALDPIGGNNGTVTGATATTGVRGVANTAYAFDGVDDYINISYISGITALTSNHTVSLWFKSAGDGGLINISNGSSRNGIVVSGSVAKVDYYINTTGYIAKSTSISRDVWYHIIMVNQEGLISGYLNLTNMTGTTNNLLGTNNSIGYAANVGYFNGIVDNVRVYNKALTAEEVLSIYNTEKP